jgi:c-di-GMP-binding flagellar brake protein YcgR
MRLPIQSMQAIRICDPGSGQWFRSVIVDYEPDQELVVLLPSEKDRDLDADTTPIRASQPDGEGSEGEPGSSREDFLEPPTFNKGASVQVEVSLADGIRRFKSVVQRLELTYGGCLRITWPTEGTRIQRRDYVRVDVTYHTIVRFLEDEERPDEEGPVRKRQQHPREMEGTTLDFSAGGMRLRMVQPLPADLKLDIDVGVPALESTVLKGRVVRSGEIEKKRPDLPQFYWVAIEFVGVDAQLRKELTQLVFDIQREQLRKRYDEES